MDWYILAIILFLGLLFLLALGLPVAFSLGLASLVGIFIFIGPQALGQITILIMDYGTNATFLAIPLFVLMAELISSSGIASDIFTAAQRWVSRLPGSLGISSILACGVFGAICGTSTGGAVAMGLVIIPELLKRGYNRSLATGAVAAGGTLSILIPPSGIMILYALIAEQSIGRMFIAGVIPGIMMVGLFSLYITIYAKLKPGVAPSPPGVSWRDKFVSLRPVWAVILLIIVVLGAIYTGVCTVVEAAAVGAFVALLIALANRKISRHSLREAAMRTTQVTCFIYFIIFGAMTFGYLLSYLRIPFELSELIVRVGVAPIFVIIMVMVLYLILGCFLDGASILVLTIPILLPALQRLGVDPIWFGIIATMNMEMSNITPPVGLNLFVVKKDVSPPQVNLEDVIRGSVPFVAVLALGIALIIIFPQIALWLPNTMMGR